MLGLAALGLAVACGGSSPSPAPPATPTPASALITDGPGDNPQAFLQAIPTSERDCVAQALGTENLLEVFGTVPLSSEDMAKFTGCLSEDTNRRMVLGVMMVELGISEQNIQCMSAGSGDVSISQTQTFSFQIFRAAFDCLSEGEAAEMFGAVEEGGGPSMAQFKCMFEVADDGTIAKLFAVGAGAGEDASLPPELRDIITTCGPIPGQGGESGPPDLTPEQENCVIEAIGETAFSQLFTGQRPPVLDEVHKIEACGVPTGPG